VTTRDPGASGGWKWAAAAGTALATFAILYTAGAALGAWPQLPPDAFWGWDLWVGIAAGVILLAGLLRGSAKRQFG
jgi:hypothetical protein